MPNSKIVIGVGGASCSGKSTLCSYLHYLLPNSFILRQDSFYKSDSLIPICNGTSNWDTPDAIDMINFTQSISSARSDQVPQSLASNQDLQVSLGGMELDESQVQQLRDAVNGKTVVIVDGFLIYADERVYNQFDVSIFLEASKEELEKRRLQRDGYVTTEGYWADPEGYFEDFVWPQYLLYNQNVFQGQIRNLIRLSSQNGISTMIHDSIKELVNLKW